MTADILASAVFDTTSIKIVASPYLRLGTSWLDEDQRLLVVNSHDLKSGEWKNSRVSGPGVGKTHPDVVEFRECMDKCIELLKGSGLWEGSK